MQLKRLLSVFAYLLCSTLLPQGVHSFTSPALSPSSKHGQSTVQQRHALINKHRSFERTVSRTTAWRRVWFESATRMKRTKLKSIVMDIVGTSPEPIHEAFAFATFGPQPFWLLLIFLPKAEITKKIMGKLDIVLFFALTHFFIVSASIVQPEATAPLLEFNDVFNPSKDSQAAFMNMVTNYPNFVAEEWSHVLTWDLFVGRWIWLDGLKRGVFTSHSVLFCNLIGPPGLLLHWLTCAVTGKGFSDNDDLEGDGGEE